MKLNKIIQSKQDEMKAKEYEITQFVENKYRQQVPAHIMRTIMHALCTRTPRHLIFKQEAKAQFTLL